MKVSIITLHRITNFGSLLQSYATQRAVEELGHEAEIIDFVPEGISFFRGCFPKNDSPLWKKLLKFFPLFVCNLIEFSVVEKFIKCYIHTTPIRYHSYADLKNDTPDADVYMTGSDQVWNTQNNNPPEDLNAYYLGFAPDDKRKIAYAGSFGKDKFPEEESERISKLLARYDMISVREDTGLGILKAHGITKGVHVLDPTFLLLPGEWKALRAKSQPKPGYVFVYNLNRNPLVKEIAQAIAKQKNLRIINFADSFDFMHGAKNRLFNTPHDFISHIANADLVVTDSFHGISFSINHERQFICIKAPKFNSRIESILRTAGLDDSRLVGSLEEGIRAAENDVDYSEVTPRINAARERSKVFLKEALSL